MNNNALMLCNRIANYLQVFVHLQECAIFILAG